jgi:hypothetical protein
MASSSSAKSPPDHDRARSTQKQQDDDAYAAQYYAQQQEHWDESYAEHGDEQPPTRGGWITKNTVSKPAPDPPPVNNPK